MGRLLLNENDLVDAIQASIKSSHLTEADDGDPMKPFTVMVQLGVDLGSSKSLMSLGNASLIRKEARTGLYINLSELGDRNNLADYDSRVERFLKKVVENPEILVHSVVQDEASWEVGTVLFRFLLLPEEDLNINLTLESVTVGSLFSIEI
jgi:hypothetical protein